MKTVPDLALRLFLLAVALTGCEAALAQDSPPEDQELGLRQEEGVVDPDNDSSTPFLNAENVIAANQLLTQLEVETRDDAWADPMEAAIEEGVAAISGEDAVILVLDCRTSLCRLQLEFSDTGGHAMVGGELHRHLPPFDEIWFYIDSISPWRSTFWIARWGVPLIQHWTE